MMHLDIDVTQIATAPTSAKSMLMSQIEKVVSKCNTPARSELCSLAFVLQTVQTLFA